MFGISIEILAALISVLLGAGANLLTPKISDNYLRFFKELLGEKEEKPKEVGHGEKLRGLIDNLATSSREFDSVITELAEVTKQREQTLKEKESNLEQIEKNLLVLQSREKELNETLSELEKTSPKVAEYFAELTSQGEKRSARRDYKLFAAGAVVSTILTIVLKLIFGI